MPWSKIAGRRSPRGAGHDRARRAADLSSRHADRVAVRHGHRRSATAGAGPEQEDFEVFDNDKPQPIVLFENDVQPITVVVMLDTSGSMTGSIDLLRQAAEQFVLRLLPDGQGEGRRVQRQDRGERDVHQRSRRPGQRREESGLRQRDAAVRCDRAQPRRVEGHRRTTRRPRVHRRRRHVEPDRAWGRSSIARAPRK